jgi:hypothetical protein
MKRESCMPFLVVDVGPLSVRPIIVLLDLGVQGLRLLSLTHPLFSSPRA